MFKVTGRVYVEETDEGLPDLHVKAVDKDLFFDDVLGTAITDKDGHYEIIYEKKDFSEFFEQSPDVYIVVRNLEDGVILFTSVDSVLCNADAEETIDVPIPQGDIDDIPYGPERGTVNFSITASSALPAEITVFFTEHLQIRRQHRFTVQSKKDISIELPTGEYTMQLLADGFDTVRGLVHVRRKQAFSFNAKLKSRVIHTLSFEERLKKYDFDVSQTDISDLNVPANTTISLNYQNDDEKLGFQMLQAKTVSQLKRWLGNDNKYIGHDRAVFGRLPEKKYLAKFDDPKTDLTTLETDELEALSALAHEFVHGNSDAVLKKYEGVVNRAMATRLQGGFSQVPIYFYTQVTINAGATLEVGNGSSIFACDKLRIHTTGTLKPVGSVSIEIGTYEEF